MVNDFENLRKQNEIFDFSKFYSGSKSFYSFLILHKKFQIKFDKLKNK